MILGIDPGVQNCGLAWFDTTTNTYTLFNMYDIDEKEINDKDELVISVRKYHKFFNYLLSFLTKVDYVAIEKPFFMPHTLANNIRTLEVIGIIKLACEHHNIPYKEYSPATIKKQVTGSGRATKQFVTEGINKLFDLNLVSTHLVDAASVAYTFFKKEINY